MAAQLKRLSFAFAAAFAVVVLAAGFWGLVRADDLLARADNPRRVLDERRIARGTIEDRHERVLAEAVGVPGALERHYPYPALAPVLGYISPLYGSAGIEAALDDVLHGGEGVDAFDQFWLGTVLGQPPPGRAVRLTLDLALQHAADEALGDHAGAAVVLDIRTGHLLALASHPNYDANQLDETWEALVADPASPLLNRATLGLYQPGGALWPLTLAAAIRHDPGLLTQVYALADEGLPDNTCHRPLPLERISLREALLYGCPGPFASIGRTVGVVGLFDTFEAFRLRTPPTLAVPTTAGGSAPMNDPAAEAVGQGQWPVTPLHMALALAAIVGDGVMPAPQLVLATQGANGIWRPAVPEGESVQALSAEAAAQIKALLPQDYVATARAGTEGQTQAWFLGFTPREGTQQVVVVLLEDGDTTAARGVGNALMLALAGH